MLKHSLLALTVVLLPSLAHADPDVSLRSRVGATVGITPIGEAGVEYTQSIGRFAEVGVGAGMSIFMGVQAAVMPRLRYATAHMTYSLGAGLSVGQHQDPSECDSDQPGCGNRLTALWGNFEAGAQWTGGSGIFVRAFGGAGRIVANTPMTMDSNPYGWGYQHDHWTFGGFGGITVGKAL